MSERTPRAGALSAAKKALLEKMLAGKSGTERPALTIPRRVPGPSALLSFAQQRLWFIHQIDPRSPAYNMPTALRLRGKLNRGVLERVLAEVVRRHEGLRTRFPAEGGAPRQIVDDPAPVAVPLADLTGLSPGEREREIARLSREEAGAPFDLVSGPLLRARLLRASADEHVFLLTMHHIVSDGWSMGVLVGEIAALYEAFAEGRPSPLPELPIQYPDFAEWQRAMLAGGKESSELAYWRERLDPPPPILDLPTDHPRPSVPSFRGGVERLSVPEETVRALRGLAREEGATLFMVLLAAFTGLLSRLTAEDDIAIGTGIANRTFPELEPLIGFFVNALVLRTRCEGDPPFRELVARAKETTLGAYSHQEVPFERIVEELHPERDLRRNPLFQVAFALQNAPLGTFELPGLTIGSAPSETGATRFDLELHLWETGGSGLDGFLFYAADLFEAATVRRITGSYGAILSSIAENPDRRLSFLRVTSGDEVLRATRELARGQALEVPKALPLQRFEEHVARAPRALAIAQDGLEVDYGVLDVAAERLAASLRARGAGRGGRVAILAERSAALVAAVVAVAKTGAAYIPLDPANPDARIRAMLARSGASLLIAPAALAERARGASAPVVILDAEEMFAPAAAAVVDEELARGRSAEDVAPADLAYVIFTSGSTGEPNGVEVPHAGLANLVAWHHDAFGLTSNDRGTLVAGPGFDASVWEIWTVLAAGASLHVPADAVRLDPPALRDWLESCGATIGFLPTPLAERVLALPGEPPPSLRVLLTGGDRLHTLPGHAGWVRVVNNYGPTEASVVATSGDADGGGAREAPTIGRPIANASAYVLDRRVESVPIGAAGELYVGGAGVARGYTGLPALTAERFLPDPWSDRPGTRMYRTGDRARQLADGRIEFLGRVDAQVKLRGVRIEPGEIESALVRHPRVAAAAVVAREAAAEASLTAYIVPRRELTAAAEWEDQHVARWRELYDATYVGSGERLERDFNIAGWNSSYTGAPIDPGEMREWREATVARILALSPRRVLEIGCGTGLLLARIAPRCERYVATDFSRVSLDLVARLCAERADLAHIERLERTADDFTGIEPGSFDTVILNSVVQYFPNRDYLDRVLVGALRAVAPGGSVFIGDVRDLRLQEAFAASVALEGTPPDREGLAEGRDVDEIDRARARAARLVAHEEELLVHPDLFAEAASRDPRGAIALPLVKRGRADNELTRFRYDVVVRVGEAKGEDDGGASASWWDGQRKVRVPFEESARLAALFRSDAEIIVLTGVPNARLVKSLEAVARLAAEDGDDAGPAGAPERPALHPDDAAALGRPHGFTGNAMLSCASPEAFDVVYFRHHAARTADCEAFDLATAARAAGPFLERAGPEARLLTNAPLRGAIQASLSAQLREHAARLLPEAMVPGVFLLLDELPVTPSGKIDRARLPAPTGPANRGAVFHEPRTPIERTIANIWAEVLGVPRIGVRDDFFALGGHSLLATQVLSRLRAALGVELPLRALFESPVLANLARRIDATALDGPSTPAVRAEDGEGSEPRGPGRVRPTLIPRADRSVPMPLSFAQQRLWFIDALEPGGAAYNIPNALRFAGDLDVAALARALAEIVGRHEALRTRFVSGVADPLQVVDPAPTPTLSVEDLSGETDPEGAARGLLASEFVKPFDLSRGPLLRARLLKLGPRDHVLSMVVHHIAADGWSVGILVRELCKIYEAFSSGAGNPLAELPLQYADWALWQRNHLEDSELGRQLAWWRDELAGVPALELPTDRARPVHPSQRGEAIEVTLDAAVVRAVARLARESGATLNMALLAAFGSILGRWSGQDVFAVGTPVAGRSRVEIESLVGFFVNTVAVRLSLEGRKLTYRELLVRVREAALGAYANQDVPFERVVEEIQPDRDTSRNPIFQVLFGLHNMPMGDFALPRLKVSAFAVECATAQFDLELSLFEVEGGSLVGYLRFATDLFDRDRMERLVSHFCRILEDVVADPDMELKRVAILPDAERARIGALQENRRAYDLPACLATIFEQRADLSPDAAALAGAGLDPPVTYAELEARANRLARLIASRGVRPGMLVAIALPRGADLIANVLAALKAGTAYVPVDPRYPASRVALMLEDARPALVLTTEALREQFDAAGVPVVALDREAAALEATSAARPWRDPGSPDDLAYVIFTSGTTGRPKGIAMRHGPITNLVAWQVEASGSPPPGRRTAQFSSLSFDVSVQEIFSTFAEGGTLVLLTEEERGDPRALLEALERERVDRLFLPFVALNALAEGAAQWPTTALRLREVITAGEQLRVTSAIRRFFASLPGATLDNHYGPSEAHVVTVERLAGDPGAWPELPAIGRPVPNACVLILDREMAPAPLGVSGEIYVGGDVLARGYLVRADLTADRFVPDPYGNGARLYRTGDRGSMGSDGRIAFLGRIDRQVKVRGYRVEPAEIEVAIGRLPGVRAVVVDARMPRGAAPRLVAWIVPETGAFAGAGALRTELARALPDYLVPTAYVILDVLPLDSNGKVDRKALPDPTPEMEASFTERSPLEDLVAGVFEEVLGFPRIGRDASFFEMGGHSLLATSAVARLRRAAGVEIPLRALFERPTIRSLALEVAAALAGDGATRASAIPRSPHGTGAEPIPLSFQQERLWFLEQFDASLARATGLPTPTTYTMLGTLRLRGDLDAEALGRAIDALAARHESLRTRFPEEDGRPRQTIDPPRAGLLEIEDLAGAAPADASPGSIEASLLAQMEAEARTGYDLARGPLWHARLLRLGPRDHAFVLAMHHIVTDGWSMSVLIRELGALYEALSAPPTASPPAPRLVELPIQYADYAIWQRRWLGEGELARQLAWWRGRLTGIEPLDLPTDRPRPATQSRQGARVRGRLDPAIVEELRGLARAEGATLHMVLLAAYALVLGRWAGRDEVAVGTPVAGRTREETEGLIGFFVNTLVLRVPLTGTTPPEPAAVPDRDGESFRGLLARVRETALGAYAHQDVPFESLLEAIRPPRDLSRSPVFQVWFNLVNVPDVEARFGALDVTLLGVDAVDAKFDLSLYAVESGEAIVLDAVYATDLFDAWRIEELLSQFETVLVQAVADPNVALADISLVTANARDSIPDAHVPLPADWRGSVHDLFERRAAANPEALAVQGTGRAWSYAELDARTRALARALAARGVREGDPVAVFAHRSAATVAAMLGVLRAGGVLMMLDPAHPAARLRLCLEEARPRAIVTIAAAGPLPEALAAFVADDLGAVRLDLREAGTGDDGLAGLSGDAPAVVGPDDPACLTFTSGSTGRPKGVLGRHGSLTHFQPYLESRFGISPRDRFSMLSGLAHDPLQRDVFTPLAAGASVIVPAPEDMDPARLAPWARASRITVMTLTPAMGKMLVSGAEPGSLPELRAIFLVGEMLARADAERLRAVAPAATLVNLYGTTETQRAVGHFVMPAEGPLHGQDGTPLTRGTIPAGAGMPGAQLLVRVEKGAPAGLCERGEIWVRSPHLALGYLDPALTRERFVGEGPARAYRTGDLGRYERGGIVAVEGRRDLQLNVRGFRIEPGEVESALASAPGVDGAVAALDAEGRLVGYVTPSRGERPDPREVRETVRARLPEGMVPAAVVVLEALPLTPNGKIDRAALPAAAFGAPETYVPPRSPEEETACALFADVLGVPRVGAADSFFDLGGHSLLATRLVARARATVGVEVSLRDLFESPTPEGLAGLFAAARRQESTPPPAVVRASPEARAGLSHAQRRLWFLERLQPGTAAFNVASALRLSGELDVAALARVFRELEARHEVLRARFSADADDPCWRADPPRSEPLSIVDVSRAADPAAEAALRVEKDARAPFDIEHGPVWRATLFQVSGTEHLLSLVLHHIVTDGWSMEILMRETTELYSAFVEGRESPLPPLAIQYADWAAWQRAWLESGERERQLEWWRRELDGAHPLELPADRPRPPRRMLRGAHAGFTVPDSAGAALARFARSEGTTLFHALLACFQMLLARTSADDDVVVGIPVANRTREESAPLVGLFVNTLPIRVCIDADASLRENVRRVREKTLDAHARQDVPIESIVEAVRVPRDLARNPIFDAMFVLQHTTGVGRRTAPGLTVEPIAADTGIAEFDLTLTMAESEGRLFGSLIYDTYLFEASTAERLVGQLVALVSALGHDPDARLGDVILSSWADRERIERMNGTAVARPERTVTDVFEEVAALHGGALAVQDAETSLTYAELNARAGAVARALRTRGIRPEAGVALLTGRTCGAVVGVIGILKSGGVLVPLDPSLPVARLEAMLAAADVRAVVADRGFESAIGRVRGRGLSVVRLDVASEPTERDGTPRAADVSVALVRPENAAYVIFTSGSTGEPKGTLVEHRAIVDRMLCRVAQSSLGPGDRCLHFLSQVFDAALEEILTPLFAGAAIVVHPDPRGETPSDWLSGVDRSGITVAHLPVGFVNELADELAWSGKDLPASLRLIVTGGESPSGARLAALLRAGGGRVSVTNAYGPTEAVVEVTALDLTDQDECLDPVPIGKPLDNCTVHLLDGRLRPVPYGAFGELYIGGPWLARGYAGRPAETAAAFVPDPFSDAPGARLYRTGDIACYRGDGTLVFAGRRDAQIKIRGFRVELEEIEAALLRANGVREAAVVVRGDGVRASLTAFVVTTSKETFDAGAARETLRGRLPEYMIPTDIVPIESLPRTAGGKIDRRALKAIEAAVQPPMRTPARDELEQAVATVWRETLGSDEEDIHESFFDAGGNSLLAVRLVAAIRRTLGRELPVAEVFRRPTIAELAHALRSESGGDTTDHDLVTLRRGDGLPPLVCVHEIGGGVAPFAALAAHLDPRRPVLGIQALDGRITGSVEDVASAHAASVARAVPEGPIHLLGWSYGALLAYEIARRLRAAGREVGSLVLLDAAAPLPKAAAGASPLVQVSQAAVAHAARTLWGIEVEGADAASAIRGARAAGVLPDDVTDADARTWLTGIAARLEAAERYRAEPYPGEAMLVRATDSGFDDTRGDALGWESLVRGGLTVEWAPGSHDSMVEAEGGRVIASIVEHHIAAARGSAAPGWRAARGRSRPSARDADAPPRHLREGEERLPQV